MLVRSIFVRRKKTLKRGSVDPKPPKTDIVYISDSQQLIVWDKCVCVCFIIGIIIISSPSFTLANLGKFFLNISVSQQKTEEKKYLIIISIKFLRGMWIFLLLLSLKHFSLEQGKSWLATFASLKLARPFLMKPPKSILYLCRIVAHNGLKTKNNKNKPDWNTNFTPKLFKIEIIYWAIFPFLSQHTLIFSSGAKSTNV